jgi:hypothetical protein
MKELPRLELTEDPNKKNDYIIFRHSMKGKTTRKSSTVKHIKSKSRKHKSRKSKSRKSKSRKHKSKRRKNTKGLLDLLYN